MDPIRSKARAIVPALVFVTAFVLVGVSPASAATTAVNCPGDDLGSAIAAAAPGDTLTISGTCVGNFVVDKKLTLAGSGATLDGNGSGTTLTVNVFIKVKVTGMTITGGSGGGIANDGTLTVSKSIVTGNSADSGGGIFNDAEGAVIISNSTVSGNTAGSGGGIDNNFGTFTITNSILSENSADSGGGILNSGTLTISRSTLSENSAVGVDGLGGGIDNDGTLHLSNSTLRGNSATYGGGIFSDGPLTVTTSTFSANTAIDGGGILNEASTTTVTNSTFSGNSATGTEANLQNGGAIDSGDLFPDSELGHLTVTNSTFSGNTANGPGTDIDTYGASDAMFTGTILSSSASGAICNSIDTSTIIDGGYNISSDASCPFSGTSLNSTDAMLGALANNGGPTQTMSLDRLSPAVDAIPVGLSCLASGTKDQRGVARPQGVSCDIGAFELNAPWIASVTVDPSGVGGNSPSVSGTITCNQGASFTVSITLTQKKLKAFGTSTGACDGATPVVWTTTVTPGTFAPGPAKVSFTATVGSVKKTGKVTITLTY